MFSRGFFCVGVVTAAGELKRISAQWGVPWCSEIGCGPTPSTHFVFMDLFFLGCPIIAHQNGLERSFCLPFAAFGTKTYFPGLYHNVGDKVLDVWAVCPSPSKVGPTTPLVDLPAVFRTLLFWGPPSKNMAGPFLKWTKMKRATETAKKPHPLYDPPCKSRKRPLKWVRLPWHCWLSITTKIHGSLRFKAIKFMAFPWNCKGDGLGGKIPRNMHLITLFPQFKPPPGCLTWAGKALFSSALIGALPGMLDACLALGTGSFFVCLFSSSAHFCSANNLQHFHVWPTSQDVKKDLSDPPRTFCNTCGFAAKKRHVIPFSCRAESSATT